jgi:hypothetical protein
LDLKSSNLKNPKDSAHLARQIIATTNCSAEEILYANLNATLWVIDSGATAHVCKDKSKFSNYREVQNKLIEVATKETAKVYGIGDIVMEIESKGQIIMLELKNVLHVPNFAKNLISVRELYYAGHEIHFARPNPILYIDGDSSKSINFEEGFSKLWHIREAISSSNDQAYSSNAPDDIYLWHQRYGHQNFGMIYNLKDHVHGMKLPKNF